MSKLVISDQHLRALGELDNLNREINTKKIKLLFEVLGIVLSEADFARILDWKLICITVADRQMAVQLNKLGAYIPNLLFIADSGQPLFTLSQGKKERRVWKK